MKNDKVKTIISVVLFLGFAGMFMIGMKSGEIEVVLNKAINICLQCIGIG